MIKTYKGHKVEPVKELKGIYLVEGLTQGGSPVYLKVCPVCNKPVTTTDMHLDVDGLDKHYFCLKAVSQ